MRNIVITSTACTAVGSFGGSLKGFTPTEIGISTAKAVIAHAKIRWKSHAALWNR